ncbi:MAG: phage terminase large subunit [Deltaproteobacteria bacterium]|nr:phage terminase large subunit [Deltaproteobacteria bacterium]MBW1986897.1 phage terminase large subunit [Deltaproteobacteria bacterium]MBW2135007.1 phage terminase large subunit [Deltaproteobacteria bacterium]
MTLKRKLTRTEFRQRVDEILIRLNLEVTSFLPETEGQREDRLQRAARDPLFFCKTYLPHYFSQAPAPFQYELVKLLEQRAVLKSPEAEPEKEAEGNDGLATAVTPVVVAAPREFAKTTLCSFGYVLHQICFGKRHFIIIGSDTEDLASDLTGYIYLELLYNDRIRDDFGELVKGNRPVNDFVTTNDIRVKARGRGQRLRGLKHRQWRPDLVILDDLENDTNVRNPKIVQQILNWVKSAVYPAIDAGGNLFIIGTVLRWHSALHIMLTSEEEPYCYFGRRIYRAIQEDGTSLWEAKHPLKKLLLEKQLMGTVAFNREKMNEPVQEAGLFQQQWIHYYHPDCLKDRNLIVTGFFDPSIESGASADYKACVTVGFDSKEMVFYVLDAFIQKATLEHTLNIIFDRHQEFNYHLLGVEDNLFQRLLLKEFERLGQERGQILPIKGVTNRIAKETRIAGLSPLLERGKIRFIRGHSDQELLIEQLLYFPSASIHDDGPDALEGAIRLAQRLPVGLPRYAPLQKRAFGSRGAY